MKLSGPCPAADGAWGVCCIVTLLAYPGSECAFRKLFEEGLPGNFAAALAATAKAPVHALTNGVHAAAASIASVAALPFANGESLGLGSPCCHGLAALLANFLASVNTFCVRMRHDGLFPTQHVW